MGTLRSHTIRHSGYKPIACSKCPKRFFSKADLRKHMDVHSDAKYICCLCGSTLNSKRSLDEHTSKFTLDINTHKHVPVPHIFSAIEINIETIIILLQDIDIEKQRNKLVICVL